MAAISALIDGDGDDDALKGVTCRFVQNRTPMHGLAALHHIVGGFSHKSVFRDDNGHELK